MRELLIRSDRDGPEDESIPDANSLTSYPSILRRVLCRLRCRVLCRLRCRVRCRVHCRVHFDHFAAIRYA